MFHKKKKKKIGRNFWPILLYGISQNYATSEYSRHS